ncbi:hypothetical protein VNO80_02813 [Phaseolus coccineus]|uniref:Uncharacterized protein n=1 Tax=Phaseolus coccineus TaxID=3886 RepID=A0AAN9RMN9_PHACN
MHLGLSLTKVSSLEILVDFLMAYKLDNLEPPHIGPFECFKHVEEKVEKMILDSATSWKRENKTTKVRTGLSNGPNKKILAKEVAPRLVSKRRKTLTSHRPMKRKVSTNSLAKDSNSDELNVAILTKE